MPGKDADTVEEWLLIVENGPNGKSVEINANDEKAEFRIGRQDNVVRTARKKPCEFLRLLAKNRGKTGLPARHRVRDGTQRHTHVCQGRHHRDA